MHADARTVEGTDWPLIVALYDQLLAVAPTEVVSLDRAIAIGEVRGPAAGLTLVDELDLDNYYPFHATRADLLRRLGRASEASGCLHARGRIGADRGRARLPQTRWSSLAIGTGDPSVAATRTVGLAYGLSVSPSRGGIRRSRRCQGSRCLGLAS